VTAQQSELKRSRRSFMHWPTAWLWVAVIVAMALLILVGIEMSETGSRSKGNGTSAPIARVNT